MRDSSEIIRSPEAISILRARLATAEQSRACDAPVMVATGHAGVDAATGGGIMRARLHEIHAATLEDGGSASGFAAMLGARLARRGATGFWLREQAAEARGGCLHAPGLAEIGVDPGRIVLGVMDDALALLRVAAEVVRCPDIDVAVIELWKNPRALDLTATRRLAVAAQASGVTVLMLRADAEPGPSAAQTRWSVASACAVPLEANAPGHPTFELRLMRQRGGPADGVWQVEWDREQKIFREPTLSGVVVPLSVGGSLATDDRRAG